MLPGAKPDSAINLCASVGSRPRILKVPTRNCLPFSKVNDERDEAARLVNLEGRDSSEVDEAAFGLQVAKRFKAFAELVRIKNIALADREKRSHLLRVGDPARTELEVACAWVLSVKIRIGRLVNPKRELKHNFRGEPVYVVLRYERKSSGFFAVSGWQYFLVVRGLRTATRDRATACCRPAAFCRTTAFCHTTAFGDSIGDAACTGYPGLTGSGRAGG